MESGNGRAGEGEDRRRSETVTMGSGVFYGEEHSWTRSQRDSTDETLLQKGDFGSKFQVEGVLGSGGMGTVVKVRHRALDQVRAIKLLNTFCEGVDSKSFERLRREARIASDLSHPSVVRVFDFDTTARGNPYIVMEYLEGMDLERSLHEKKRFSLEETVRVLAGVANALDEVHKRGVIHRDLKPANIFVTETNVAKILDFGISHAERNRSKLTNTGEVMGTPVYMAPEQLRGENVGPWSDIYALAAVAQELLTGRPIFDEATPGLLVASVLEKEPRESRIDAPELPPHAVSALKRGLEKRPEDRHESAWDFVSELAGPSLEKTLESTDMYMTPSRLVKIQSGSMRLKRARFGRKRMAIVAAAMSLAILVLLAGLLLGGSIFEKEPGYIVLKPPTVKGDSTGNGWGSKELGSLVLAYLDLDDCIGQVRTGNKEGAAGAKGTVGVLTLQVEKNGKEWWGEFSLDEDGDGTPDWSFAGGFTGLEKLVEEATWRLHEEFLFEKYAPSRAKVGSCRRGDLDCRYSSMARTALEGHGLFERIDRLASLPGEDRKRLKIWKGTADLIRCVARTTSKDCLDREKVDVHDVAGELERSLANTLSEGSTRQQGLDGLCELSKEDSLARGVLKIVESDSTCAETKESSCARLDTFLDRLACMTESGMRDAEEITGAYAEEILERDLGNSVYAGSFAVIRKGMESATPKGPIWYERMKSRYGEEDELFAAGSFVRKMVERDSTAALIWARRTEAPLWREGLALLLGGWLRSGIDKSAEGAARIASKEGGLTQREVQLVLRPALQAVLLTRDSQLAEVWLEAVSRIEVRDEHLGRGEKLVRALAMNERDICDRGTPLGGEFEIERLFFCERWNDLAGLLEPGGSSGYENVVSKYYYAVTMMMIDREKEALEAFKEIEADPLSRTVLPISALYALESAGSMKIERGEKEAGCQNLSEFLRLWDGLDVPLENYLLAQSKMGTCI